ncbi:unnamed protein product [Prorocentrum cordatum]|uniref:Uncharacterized protein n=1 Tax=Prorocentrum cordatum TaxID=2364126 RepID=A0ABN9VC72_9DINO|nr:unnamed protein product [Polarella glacialis]
MVLDAITGACWGPEEQSCSETAVLCTVMGPAQGNPAPQPRHPRRQQRKDDEVEHESEEEEERGGVGWEGSRQLRTAPRRRQRRPRPRLPLRHREAAPTRTTRDCAACRRPCWHKRWPPPPPTAISTNMNRWSGDTPEESCGRLSLMSRSEIVFWFCSDCITFCRFMLWT